MESDHIFIFVEDQGSIADKLIEFGLTEGSSRIHLGQGTTNRKFYFKNFFLEILWVHDLSEFKNEKNEPMGLWQRSRFKNNNFSPFGLCIVNNDAANSLFKDATSFQADYFPDGMALSIIKNQDSPDLPWTFRLPFKKQNSLENEASKHKNGISFLTKIIFEHTQDTNTTFLDHFKNDTNIQFFLGFRIWLTLIFDNSIQGKNIQFESLQLTIEY